MHTLIPLGRVVRSKRAVSKNKGRLTERSHKFKRFWDLSCREVSKVSHNGGLRELKLRFLFLNSKKDFKNI